MCRRVFDGHVRSPTCLLSRVLVNTAVPTPSSNIDFSKESVQGQCSLQELLWNGQGEEFGRRRHLGKACVARKLWCPRRVFDGQSSISICFWSHVLAEAFQSFLVLHVRESISGWTAGSMQRLISAASYGVGEEQPLLRRCQ